MEITEQYIEKFEEAMDDEDFAKKVANAESEEEIKELFLTEKGIEMVDEVVQAAFARMKEIENGAELTEEEMEAVAGGKCYYKCNKCRREFSSWLKFAVHKLVFTFCRRAKPIKYCR